MHSISNSVRRATRDLDLDFIKYSLEDKSIKEFINKLNTINDNITIKIIGKIEELHHQDYNGKRVYIKLIDTNNYTIDTKLDIGVHKLFELEQDEYYFNLNALNEGVSLFINSPEQIFAEKLKSLLKLGSISARHKDLFNFYYLINYKKLDSQKLLKAFQIIIFNDDNMYEKTLDNIYDRLNKVFNSNVYKNNIKNTKNNWLDITINEAIQCLLEYIKKLSNNNNNFNYIS